MFKDTIPIGIVHGIHSDSLGDESYTLMDRSHSGISPLPPAPQLYCPAHFFSHHLPAAPNKTLGRRTNFVISKFSWVNEEDCVILL
mgnify:CR=1 FL=1